MTNKQINTIELEIGRCELRLNELIKNLKEYQIIINTDEYVRLVTTIQSLRWILDNYDEMQKHIDKL